MKPDKMEQSLNKVVSELCNGINALAEKVRCGANPEEIADTMSALADRLCEHWPNCFTELKAKREKETAKSPKAKSPAKSPKSKY
jgi:hypothetical protein